MKIIKGDLFSTECDIIAHGVNCKGGFGSGVAGQIAKHYPLAKKEYLRKYNDEKWKLGDIQLITINPRLMIANIATQENYGRAKLQYVDYAALKIGLDRVFEFAQDIKLSIAAPMIGAGLGGGDPKKILSIFKDISSDFPRVSFEVYYQ